MYIGCEVTKYPGRDKANNEDFFSFFRVKYNVFERQTVRGNHT